MGPEGSFIGTFCHNPGEFHETGRVALNVPVDVQHRQGIVRPSQFQIYLERFEGSLQNIGRCSFATGLLSPTFAVD